MMSRFFPVLLVALSGCKSLGSGATETYSTLYSCPTARIQTKERSDLRAEAVVARWHEETGTRAAEPPAEVAVDPERLALWKARRAEMLAALDRRTAFEVTGCDHHELLLCAHPTNPKNGATYVNDVTCLRNPFGDEGRDETPAENRY